jgi:uncharacterized protein YgiM (DUF1202 family)
MKITFGPVVTWMALFLLAFPSSVLAQQATASRNVILRRDPSTASPALEHLPKGARLVLVDATADGGFYHVRTEDDQVGWVLSTYVRVSPPGDGGGGGGGGGGRAMPFGGITSTTPIALS